MLYPPTPFPSRVPPDDNSFFTLPLELDEFSLDELPLELLPDDELLLLDDELGVPFQVVEKNVRNLDPGKYWVRIGVRTANPQKRYNFSTIKEIVVPAQTAEK